MIGKHKKKKALKSKKNTTWQRVLAVMLAFMLISSSVAVLIMPLIKVSAQSENLTNIQARNSPVDVHSMSRTRYILRLPLENIEAYATRKYSSLQALSRINHDFRNGGFMPFRVQFNNITTERGNPLRIEWRVSFYTTIHNLHHVQNSRTRARFHFQDSAYVYILPNYIRHFRRATAADFDNTYITLIHERDNTPTTALRLMRYAWSSMWNGMNFGGDHSLRGASVIEIQEAEIPEDQLNQHGDITGETTHPSSLPSYWLRRIHAWVEDFFGITIPFFIFVPAFILACVVGGYVFLMVVASLIKAVK